jgi:chromosome segregation ATPase/ActR/RegA family two-component response regulator
MSKSVLIVEKDLALMKELREGLKNKGFEVEETTDGKGAPELIRKQKPGVVVLAVDLDAGQNGYIICKKLKSDDELKGVPVIIIGDPKGFAQHQKLKTRAEEYVGKPLTADALGDAVGKLIGFPELAAPAADDSFDPGSLLEEDASEIPLETPIEDVGSAEADLAMVDSMFDEKPAEVEAPPVEEEISLSTPDLEESESDYPADKTVVGFMPMAPPPPTTPATVKTFSSSPSLADSSELRSKVTELTGALEESRSRSEELEAKVRELEAELETKNTDLETARASTGKADNKEVFALREAGTKKDKEILRLKNELNAKEQEILELHEKENTIEQQLSDASGELAKKDAQLKTLQAKADQSLGDRKKIDQQLLTAKEEARSASARLQTLQGDFDQLQQRVAELDGQLEGMKASQQESESARQTAESELSEARGEIEALKSQLEERSREADEARSQMEQAQIDLDSARTQLTTQATSFADEISGLRQRLAEVEAESTRAEEKANRAQSRLKAYQDQADRLRSSLQQAMDTLAETPAESEDLDIDEIAEA